MNKICEHCSYYSEIPNTQPPYGDCRRYPPRNQGRNFAEWPKVKTNDWCGEFTPRNPREFYKHE